MEGTVPFSNLEDRAMVRTPWSHRTWQHRRSSGRDRREKHFPNSGRPHDHFSLPLTKPLNGTLQRRSPWMLAERGGVGGQFCLGAGTRGRCWATPAGRAPGGPCTWPAKWRMAAQPLRWGQWEGQVVGELESDCDEQSAPTFVFCLCWNQNSHTCV